MAKRRKKTSPQISYKILIVCFLLFLSIGIIFAVLDAQGKLTYEQLTAYLGLSPEPVKSEAELSVHYIDVGQGDCVLISAGETTVFIDGGEYENAPKIASYLKGLGIERLDYVIGTHPHSDHVGSLCYTIEDFEVGKVILPRLPDELVPATVTYENLLGAISEKSMKITPAKAGTIYDLGGIATLEILGPITDKSDDLNNYSVVCMLTHGGNRFLFTGDAEYDEEKDIMNSGANLSADVLKVGHHGSSSSTGRKFLSAVAPSYAVICVGAGNTYGHPSERVHDRLVDNEIEIFRTDLHGTIVAESDGFDINFITERE